ncbi:MAG: glycosyltransferase family 2 protein [Candidatus Hydrothermarchaeota archaeon]|nr:glycosyltransferase family 2 protein [Candidatus Hydrothermarchaeota archaeon]
MKTAVVIPASNEEKTIAKIVRETRKFIPDVIVVDDGSSDSTGIEAKKAGADVVRHIVNVGVGLATITGNEYAIRKGYEVIVNIDGDEQHFPKDIPRAIALLENSGLDIVFGSRFLTHSKEFPWVLKLGNKFLTLMNRLMFGSNITDTQTGFRVFRAEALKKLGIASSSYSICSEIAAKVGKRNLKYAEMPVETVFLDKFKGTTILDGIKIFINMIRWWIAR